MIEYLGYRTNSMYEGEVIREEVDTVRNTYYSEDKSKALLQLDGIFNRGLVGIGEIHKYYFERIANDGKRYNCKYSINELLASDELVQMFINSTKKNKKLFNSDLLGNFNKKLSLGAGGVCGKLTLFPLKPCIRLLETYRDENNDSNIYVDPCAGWGTRMIASAYLNIDYVGFDINPQLVPRLRELGDDIKKYKPNWKFNIIERGSQHLSQSLIGKASIVMTSPPYFNLEEYRTGHDDELMDDYNTWKEMFLSPMMNNAKQYIKSTGRVLINIKNFDKYMLEEDTISIAESLGMELETIDTLTNIQRITNDGSLLDNSEKVFVFKYKD